MRTVLLALVIFSIANAGLFLYRYIKKQHVVSWIKVNIAAFITVIVIIAVTLLESGGL